MDDTRAVFIRHISVHNHAERLILVLGKDQPVRWCRVLNEKQVAHLLRKVLKYGVVPPTPHVLALELTDLLDLGLLRVLVHGHQARFQKDEILASLLVVYLEISKVGVHAEGQVGRKCPWSRRPSQKRRLWIVHKRERDSHCVKNARESVNTHSKKNRASPNPPAGSLTSL